MLEWRTPMPSAFTFTVIDKWLKTVWDKKSSFSCCTKLWKFFVPLASHFTHRPTTADKHYSLEQGIYDSVSLVDDVILWTQILEVCLFTALSTFKYCADALFKWTEKWQSSLNRQKNNDGILQKVF